MIQDLRTGNKEEFWGRCQYKQLIIYTIIRYPLIKSIPFTLVGTKYTELFYPACNNIMRYSGCIISRYPGMSSSYHNVE